MPVKPCPCGSGLPRFEIYDNRGIFVTFICDSCEKTKLSKYDPRIFAEGQPYYADEPIDED